MNTYNRIEGIVGQYLDGDHTEMCEEIYDQFHACLRDQFAMAALPVVLSVRFKDEKVGFKTPKEVVQQVAMASYQYADAMLKAREE